MLEFWSKYQNAFTWYGGAPPLKAIAIWSHEHGDCWMSRLKDSPSEKVLGADVGAGVVWAELLLLLLLLLLLSFLLLLPFPLLPPVELEVELLVGRLGFCHERVHDVLLDALLLLLMYWSTQLPPSAFSLPLPFPALLLVDVAQVMAACSCATAQELLDEAMCPALLAVD